MHFLLNVILLHGSLTIVFSRHYYTHSTSTHNTVPLIRYDYCKDIAGLLSSLMELFPLDSYDVCAMAMAVEPSDVAKGLVVTAPATYQVQSHYRCPFSYYLFSPLIIIYISHWWLTFSCNQVQSLSLSLLLYNLFSLLLLYTYHPTGDLSLVVICCSLVARQVQSLSVPLSPLIYPHWWLASCNLFFYNRLSYNFFSYILLSPGDTQQSGVRTAWKGDRSFDDST